MPAEFGPFSRQSRCRLAAAVLAAAATAFFILAVPRVAWAQPFGTPAKLFNAGPAEGYVEIPDSASLSPSTHITIEFWSNSAPGSPCTSLLGKGLSTSYWIGNCGGTLRSFLAGQGSQRDGGTIILAGGYHHIAVTYDGTVRKHYIDGELVGVFSQTGALPANSHPLRLGSDFDFAGHSNSLLFEVRLWSVARTQDQIRQNISQEIDTPQPGLVAVWHLRGNAHDAIGGHDGGPVQGNGGYVVADVGKTCTPNPVNACFLGNRFEVLAHWNVYSDPFADGHIELTSHGDGNVVPGASDGSALFWFFGASNWELLVKMPNGTCGFGAFWLFSAATTNVHYKLIVFDASAGAARVYFNYAGPPAPAVTDTAAFATCP